MIAVSGSDESRAAEGATEVDRSAGAVVYPVFGSPTSRPFEVALDLAEGAGAELVVLALGGDQSKIERVRDHAQTCLQAHLDEQHAVPVRTRESERDGPVAAVTAAVERYGASLLVLGEELPTSLTNVVRGDVTERVSSSVPCDTVVVHEPRRTPTIASILVPIADGPHSDVSVRVAGELARGTDAWVELFHVGGTEAAATALFDDAKARLPPAVEVDTWHHEAESVSETIVEQSRHYDVTVIGSPRKGRLRRFVFGSTTTEIRSEAENVVLTTRSGDA